MPALFAVSPVSPAIAYDGTLFVGALFKYPEPARLFAYGIAFEQTAGASRTPTVEPSCNIDYLETCVLPLMSSRSKREFTPVPVRKSPKPGALLLSGRDGRHYHLRYSGLPVIDYRYLNATIALLHVVNGVHRTHADTLTALNAHFSLVPLDYVITVLSYCTACSPNNTPITPSQLPTQTAQTGVNAPQSSSTMPSDLPFSVSPGVAVRPVPKKKRVPKRRLFSERIHRRCTRAPPPSPSSPPSPSPKPVNLALQCTGVREEVSERMFADGVWGYL